jgi:hypothetical protein
LVRDTLTRCFVSEFQLLTNLPVASRFMNIHP